MQDQIQKANSDIPVGPSTNDPILLRSLAPSVETHQLVWTDRNIIASKFPRDAGGHAHLREPVCKEHIEESGARRRRPVPDLIHHKADCRFPRVRRISKGPGRTVVSPKYWNSVHL